ncbi:Serine acetyltransferase 4 [Hibiscus syriacus]|uniref:Serine acetyltransferase 4 n=1 Tax=Hibiscus syriacus TaxID=106335 RepID=A0A6A3AUV4_HIBSY|nr:Serine acetyltransferase 4 [Hibiscus syriacus]
MGCVSEKRWESFPEMLSTGLSLKETEDGDEAALESVQFPFEKVFPVYAMSLSKPDIDSTVKSGHDPIWDAVREEAKLEAEKEPILSSFLYASILAHDCLEQALAFVLANRLQNPTLLATQLMDIFSHVMMHDRDIQRSILLDLQAFMDRDPAVCHTAFMDRDPACLSYSSALLYLKGYHSLQSYRVAHALWKQGRKLLALALQAGLVRFLELTYIQPQNWRWYLLDHGTGIVIGETAVIGNRVSLMHVLLFCVKKELVDCTPDVRLFSMFQESVGVSILNVFYLLVGKELPTSMVWKDLLFITLYDAFFQGEGAMIAAGSLVLKHVPPHSMVAGTPAQVIGSIDEQDPLLTMNHGSYNFIILVRLYLPEAAKCGCYQKNFLNMLLVREMEDRNKPSNDENHDGDIDVPASVH